MMYSSTVLIKTYTAFFVQQVKDAELAFNEVNTWLVVMEINKRPRDLLTYVFILFQLEHVL